MTYTVVVTEQAARDVETAASWWARERSAEQAARWYDGIRPVPPAHSWAGSGTSNESPWRSRNRFASL